ncbi:hypothetical protein BpHYR1_009393, partial [Brachionus plicatilis]
LSLSFLYLEKTPEHNFSTDIFIFHLISHCSSSLPCLIYYFYLFIFCTELKLLQNKLKISYLSAAEKNC